MANTFYSHPAPFGAIAIFRSVTAVQDIVANAIERAEARRTRKALMNLSDEMLFDIGLERAEIANF